jgi:DNA-binding NtrC family response regulator
MSASEHRIVILDNNRQRRDALKSMVAGWGHTTFIFEKESRCLDNLAPLDADLVISGSLSVERARRFIHTLQLTNCGVPLVIISDDQEITEFVDTNGFGEVCVLNINSNPSEIESTVKRVLSGTIGSVDGTAYCPLIIGNGPEIMKIKKMIAQLEFVNVAILIQGEPGSGKELMARYIHLKSDRRDKPFVKLSVPRLPADFFEKQLLMLEDTQPEQKGLFSAAHQGTLLLEEVDRMPAESQATLLKIIDEAGMLKAAENTADVRIIATSSRDLETLAETGQFRKDLFYRLHVIRINIPPLRNRLDDIPALTDFFTDKFCIETGRSYFQLSDKMKELFGFYHWPGNVQELEELIKRIVVDGANDLVARKLQVHKKYRGISDSYKDINSLAGLSDVKKHVRDLNNISLKKIGGIFLQRAEKKLVKKALESTNWNRKRAAQLLEISYKSLLNKIKEYNLT